MQLHYKSCYNLQVADILQLIFYNSSESKCPKLEDLVMCDIFRNIDLREMRGTNIPVRIIKHVDFYSNNIKLLQLGKKDQEC